MIEGNLTNNTKTRRKGSMLQDSISKIKYFLLLALLLIVPVQAKAGIFTFNDDLIDQTDQGVDDLVYFYDTVARKTFIQVTNTASAPVTVHIQVFNATNSCIETDCDVILTGHDTNVYDIENLPDQCGAVDFSNSHGIVFVNAFTGPLDALIGMFRIIDDAGYEYRTNAASSEDGDAFEHAFSALNFNEVNGNNLSDVVGIPYVRIDDRTVFASANIQAQFGGIGVFAPTNFIFDDIENPTSCSPVIFACDQTTLNYGIDNSIPNSQGFGNICPTNKLAVGDSGWLFMPFLGELCFDPVVGIPATGECLFQGSFVGYLGLNNGNGTGSMDSFWQSSFFEVPGGDMKLAAEE